MPKATGGSSSSETFRTDKARDPYAGLFQGKSQDRATFAAIEGPSVAAAIDRILANGDAVMFGTTSDGGAVCVQIWNADLRRKLYAARQEELEQLMTALELL